MARLRTLQVRFDPLQDVARERVYSANAGREVTTLTRVVRSPGCVACGETTGNVDVVIDSRNALRFIRTA